eukprot:s1572_g19.t1
MKENEAGGAKATAPCQKELGPSTKEMEKEVKAETGRKRSSPCQKDKKEKQKGEVSLSSSSSSSSSSSPLAKQEAKRPKAAAAGAAGKPAAKSAAAVPAAKAEAPCQKDASSGSRPRNWLSDGQRWIIPKKRVAIDFHQTLAKGNGKRVHWQDKAALQKLKDKGYYLILLSYCGVERSEEIMEVLQDQDVLQYFDKIRFTWSKCGRDGKAIYCRDNHIPVLFEDNLDIVEECKTMGVYTYNTNTKKYTHTAGHWYLWQAVEQFLMDHRFFATIVVSLLDLRAGPLLTVPAAARAWTEHSERCGLVTLAALLGVPRESRDFLGRWKAFSSSDEYIRSAQQVVGNVQRLVLQGAAMKSADADLKYHLTAASVPDMVQRALFHKGFTTLPLFSGSDESREAVRAALEAEISLKHDADTESRKSWALVLKRSSGEDAGREQVRADTPHCATVRDRWYAKGSGSQLGPSAGL